MRRRVAPAVVSRGVGILSLFVVLAGAVVAQTPTQDNSSQTGATGLTTPAPLGVCRRNLRANVVALDQPLMMNRLGAAMPQGMIFALERDVVVTDPNNNRCGTPLCPGNVRLRDEKRPRPITLRMSVGDCLQINFRNLLSSDGTTTLGGMKPKTRTAGVHVAGLELRDSINSDGSWVGRNPGTTGSMVPPGSSAPYNYYAPAEGVFMLYSLDDGRQGQLGDGMWGSVNVQPSDAEYYRSQVTYDDLVQATYRPDQLPDNQTLRMFLTPKTDAEGRPINVVVDGANLPLQVLTTVEKISQTVKTSDVVTISNRIYAYEPELNGKRGHPIINYQAVYQTGPRAGTPILSMLRADGPGFELMHSDLTAIITGPNADRFPYSNVSPSFRENSATPDRRQPYREFTISYHNNFNVVQAFQEFGSNELSNMLANGQDNFGINYGMGGIGAEILANRLGVGPMGNADAVDLKFEEFFLSSWSVGDPAMVVDVPANAPNQVIGAADKGSPVDQTKLKNQLATPPIMSPLSRKKATKAFYADDPSNVYHSYMRDHLKFRIMNTGGGPPHVHHQHAHQWLHTPNSDDGHYLDSQMINPGSTYTLEMTYNGSGNRNQTVGDSIFHCHFYPHFASGMWSLWRVHDVFEAGTEMMPDPNDPSGAPVPRPGSRALPDGEITRGTPIPALVPLPTLAMAPIPARVKLSADGRTAEVIPDTGPNGQPVLANPGFPFFVPGIGGHRAPHPPLDFAWEEDDTGKPKLGADNKKIYLDGGLPRHVVLGGKIVREFHTRWDFSKDFILYDKAGKPIDGGLIAKQLPEDGTPVEKAAMGAHAIRTHRTVLPNGDPGNFTLNGLPPAPGAPFADPGVDDFGNSVVNTRRYQGANIQLDVVLNKSGWHYPQQRMITLWDDVKPTLEGKRPPQPFFFRANTGETIEYWHANLVPDYYELDDFQVRTPTDILGQHIHLVKFDVTSSDGAGNGFNYEDGTFSPDEVRGRIYAIRLQNKCTDNDPRNRTFECPLPKVIPQFGTGPNIGSTAWLGAQATIQRWDTDPLVNNEGVDRTLRTVFTHDHFGPSTHQQIGLYAGLLVEPQGSKWFDAVTGAKLYDYPARRDGGPTTWQAVIETANPADSYREFALEFQDLQQAYTKLSRSTPGPVATASAVFNVQPIANDPGFKLLAQQLNQRQIPPVLRSGFTAAGITLSGQATVTGVTPTWTINDPGAPDQNEVYAVKLNNVLNNAGQQTTFMQIYNTEMSSGWADPANAILGASPDPNNTQNGPPYPAIISAGGVGTYSLNYRSEPVPLRVNAPLGQSTQATDLAYAFSSIPRLDAALNVQPPAGTPINPANPNGFKFPPSLVPLGTNGAQPTDPYTPLLRAYAGDNVQIRTLVGAHVNTHSFLVHGVKWFSEPSSTDSGYRNAQGMGLSEHFEMLFTLPKVLVPPTRPFADYLYEGSAGTAGITNGLWGIMRAFDLRQVNPGTMSLMPLPNNRPAASAAPAESVTAFTPPDAAVLAKEGFNIRVFNIVATTATQALPNGTLILNGRGQSTGTAPPFSQTPNTQLQNPYALIFVRAEDLDANGKLKPGITPEPLILRAAAGDWISIKLTNKFDPAAATFNNTQGQGATFAGAPFSQPVFTTGLTANDQKMLDQRQISQNLQTQFSNSGNALSVSFVQVVTLGQQWVIYDSGGNTYLLRGSGGNLLVANGTLAPITLKTSQRVGLNPQLVSYDITLANGVNIGWNPDQTVGVTETKSFFWYAGNIVQTPGDVNYVPIELGTINLTPPESLVQHTKGFVGALVIEPQGSTWEVDANSQASAVVTKPDGTKFREHVALMQVNVPAFLGTSGKKLRNVGAFNYKTEPTTGYRYPPSGFSQTIPTGTAQQQANSLVNADPQTPIFTAAAGSPVRLRMLYSQGDNGQVVALHGHGWQEIPFINNSTEIGSNVESQVFGTQQLEPYETSNMLLDSAGGSFRVKGDYLYHTFLGEAAGLWGLLRVSDDLVVINQATLDPVSRTTLVQGYEMANPATGLSTSMTISKQTGGGPKIKLGTTTVNLADGTWNYTAPAGSVALGDTVIVDSLKGGSYQTTVRAK